MAESTAVLLILNDGDYDDGVSLPVFQSAKDLGGVLAVAPCPEKRLSN